MIITIDGPSGTGKTTVAKEVAQALHYDYFDTGAMYRAVSYGLLKHGVDCHCEQDLAHFLDQFSLDLQDNHGKRQYVLEGENVTEKIRLPEVTAYVSEVAARPVVRAHLVNIQRSFAKDRDTVFEGRDMGTVVFPQAELKIFLTARPEVRAQRRHLELQGSVTQEDVLVALTRRDEADSNRKHSPLKQAPDAYLIDTSDLTIEEVVQTVLRLFSKVRYD